MNADVFPSTCVEEQPIQSLIGTFEAFHASIGESMFTKNSTSSLLHHKKIFFYKYVHVVPSIKKGIGSLDFFPIPPLNSIEWLYVPE